MQISTYAQRMQLQSRVGDLQGRLHEVNGQITTGKKADSFKAMRHDTAQVLSLRQRLQTTIEYKKTIDLADTRLELVQISLQRSLDVSKEVSLEIYKGLYENESRLPGLQQTARTRLEEMVGLLNSHAGDRYLFGGTETTTTPVATAARLLEGDSSATPLPQQGLKTLMAKRAVIDGVAAKADMAAGPPDQWPGRVEVALAGTQLTLRLDDPQFEGFGYRLGSMSWLNGTEVPSRVAAGTAAHPDLPAETVPTLTVDTSTMNFYHGQVVSLEVTLPDGSPFAIRLTATSDPQDKRPDTFLYTMNPEANLAAAFAGSLERHAQIELRAASANQAADEFFKVPADVIALDGSGTTPRYRAVPDADGTVLPWYRGDTAATDPRAGARAKIDDGTVIDYGVRADETPLREALKSLAILAATPFDVAAADAYRGLADRMSAKLTASSEALEGLVGEIGTKQQLMTTTRERHAAFETLVTVQLDGIENVDLYEASARLAMYETQLQASYQITARLNSLSLVNVLR